MNIVGAVAIPQADGRRANASGDLDTLQMVIERHLADGRIGVGDAAPLVAVGLKGVGVHGTDSHALRVGVFDQVVPVFHLVPRDVDGDGGANPGELVHKAGIGQLLVDVASCARPGVGLEARAGVSKAPRRQLDVLCLEPGFHSFDVNAPGRELVGENLIAAHDRDL